MKNQSTISFVMAVFQLLAAIFDLCKFDIFWQLDFLELLIQCWIDYLEMVCVENNSFLILSKSNGRLPGLDADNHAYSSYRPSLLPIAFDVWKTSLIVVPRQKAG
jgi:hypothetical protein